MRLDDLVDFKLYVRRKTRYGDRSGPSPWHHTGRYLAEYSPVTDPAKFRRIFKSMSAANEVDAYILHSLQSAKREVRNEV
jgi:hypothetical protein